MSPRKKKPDHAALIAAANALNEAVYQHSLIVDVKEKVTGYLQVRAARWKLCEAAMQLPRVPR